MTIMLPDTAPDAYLTGTSALNIPTEDGNFADWHFDETFLREGVRFRVAGRNYPSTLEVLGNWGIRECADILRQRGVPLASGTKFYAASYARAVLDLVYNLTREHQSADFLDMSDLLDEADQAEVFRKIEELKTRVTNRLQFTLMEQWKCQQESKASI